MKQIMKYLLIIISMITMFSCNQEEYIEMKKPALEYQKGFENPITKWEFPSQMRAIGGENFFENHVNIEDFKGFPYEPNVIWKFQKEKLDSLARVDKFPNEKEGVDRENISRQLTLFAEGGQDIAEVFENGLRVNYQKPKAFLEEYDSLAKVEAYIEVIYKDSYSYALSPKEAYNFSYEERMQIRESYLQKDGHFYRVAYVPLQHYARVTGLDYTFLKHLRIITFTLNQLRKAKECDSADFTCYIYQFPYKDNYKDYSNESLILKDKWQMKKYLKPGSFLFVFDKDSTSLYNVIGLNNGHTIIVTDRYTLEPNKYHSLDEYLKIDAGKNFMDVPELRKAMFDKNVSLRDFLKHFLFIEAVSSSENDNLLLPLAKTTDIVKYTAGNDSLALSRFDNYTVFGVSNLNKGYKKANFNIINQMIDYSELEIGKSYDPVPIEFIPLMRDYCSGLVYYGFLNKSQYPSIKLLMEKHSSKTWLFMQWFMPRTLTNSPFVYTRTWYDPKLNIEPKK